MLMAYGLYRLLMLPHTSHGDLQLLPIPAWLASAHALLNVQEGIKAAAVHEQRLNRQVEQLQREARAGAWRESSLHRTLDRKDLAISQTEVKLENLKVQKSQSS